MCLILRTFMIWEWFFYFISTLEDFRLNVLRIKRLKWSGKGLEFKIHDKEIKILNRKYAYQILTLKYTKILSVVYKIFPINKASFTYIRNQTRTKIHKGNCR